MHGTTAALCAALALAATDSASMDLPAGGVAIHVTDGQEKLLKLESGSSIEGDIVLSHEDKTLNAPVLTILNRGGDAVRVTGNLLVGAGSKVGFAGDPPTLDGNVVLDDDSRLSVTAIRVPTGDPTESWRAKAVSIANRVIFNLSGVSAASATDTPLFVATESAISGDFADIAIGGKLAGYDAADPTLRTGDFLTLRTRKSDDGKSYLATYQLS